MYHSATQSALVDQKADQAVHVSGIAGLAEQLPVAEAVKRCEVDGVDLSVNAAASLGATLKDRGALAADYIVAGTDDTGANGSEKFSTLSDKDSAAAAFVLSGRYPLVIRPAAAFSLPSSSGVASPASAGSYAGWNFHANVDSGGGDLLQVRAVCHRCGRVLCMLVSI